MNTTKPELEKRLEELYLIMISDKSNEERSKALFEYLPLDSAYTQITGQQYSPKVRLNK